MYILKALQIHILKTKCTLLPLLPALASLLSDLRAEHHQLLFSRPKSSVFLDILDKHAQNHYCHQGHRYIHGFPGSLPQFWSLFCLYPPTCLLFSIPTARLPSFISTYMDYYDSLVTGLPACDIDSPLILSLYTCYSNCAKIKFGPSHPQLRVF